MRECYRQGQVEVVSNSRNKIHQNQRTAKKVGPMRVRIGNHLDYSPGNFVVTQTGEHTKLLSVLTSLGHHKTSRRIIYVIVNSSPSWALPGRLQFSHSSLCAMETRGGLPATESSGDPPPPSKASLAAKRGSLPVIRVSPAAPPAEILLYCNRHQHQQRRGSSGAPAGERGKTRESEVNVAA